MRVLLSIYTLSIYKYTPYAIYTYIYTGDARLLARNPLWNALLVHFQERDCLVDGALSNLQLSNLSLPKPRMTTDDKRLHFTALAGGGSVHRPLNNPSDYPDLRNNNSNNNYSNTYSNNNEYYDESSAPLFFGRAWGEHPDLHSHDGMSYNSQAASMGVYTQALTTHTNNTHTQGPAKMTSYKKVDSRYNHTTSVRQRK